MSMEILDNVVTKEMKRQSHLVIFFSLLFFSFAVFFFFFRGGGLHNFKEIWIMACLTMTKLIIKGWSKEGGRERGRGICPSFHSSPFQVFQGFKFLVSESFKNESILNVIDCTANSNSHRNSASNIWMLSEENKSKKIIIPKSIENNKYVLNLKFRLHLCSGICHYLVYLFRVSRKKNNVIKTYRHLSLTH